jgi:antitoxin HigA-1
MHRHSDFLGDASVLKSINPVPLTAPFKPIDERFDTAPLHPGEILREDMLPYFQVSAPEFARHIGVSLRRLNTILTEQAPITPPLAKRLGASLGQGPHFWLALQSQYDLWHGAL